MFFQKNLALRALYFEIGWRNLGVTIKGNECANFTLQELNQVVLWDKIILRGENAFLDLTNGNSKYYFFDDGAGLR